MFNSGTEFVTSSWFDGRRPVDQTGVGYAFGCPLQLERITRPGQKRLLAIDGGGIRGVPALAILRRIEEIRKKVWPRRSVPPIGLFRLVQFSIEALSGQKPVDVHEDVRFAKAAAEPVTDTRASPGASSRR
jgi:hypothetical protein